MTPEEYDRMLDLCARIKVEKDPEKFTELVDALNDLLDRKAERIQPRSRQI
jgi:hypothetical protein